MSKCLCGCMREVDQTKSRGQKKQFFNDACKNRYNRRNKRIVSVSDTENLSIKPILKYPGAKWSRASWIISHFPAHKIYLEPYCGSAAVFFNKPKANHEIIGDADGNIVNLFHILRTRGPELAAVIDLTPWSESEYEMCERHHENTGDELEDARRFLVWCWQAHGTQLGKSSQSWRHRGIKGSSSTTALWAQVPDRLLAAARRLKDAEIRNRPALELIEYYNHPDCLIYCDPPYVKATRKTTTHYSHEMTDSEHLELLEALARHKGSVVLSGYDSALYDASLPGWEKVFMPTVAEHGNVHMEVLWLNAKANRRQVTHKAVSLFGEAI